MTNDRYLLYVKEGWRCVVDPVLCTVDVIPDKDLIVHEFGEKCVCGPKMKMDVMGLDDPTLWTMFGHSALDGRRWVDIVGA